jgi:hypothetical protein
MPSFSNGTVNVWDFSHLNVSVSSFSTAARMESVYSPSKTPIFAYSVSAGMLISYCTPVLSWFMPTKDMPMSVLGVPGSFMRNMLFVFTCFHIMSCSEGLNAVSSMNPASRVLAGNVMVPSSMRPHIPSLSASSQLPYRLL